MSHKRAVIVLLATLLALLPTGVVLAALPVAPALTVQEAYYFQDVAQAGDGLLLYRASMPTANWTTYGADGAIVQLTQTTVQAQSAPPTIGEFMGGLYLAPGNSFTFGDPATVDLRSNPSIFSTATTSQVAVSYVTTGALIATSTDDQDILCATFVTLAQGIEAADGDLDPGDLYTGLAFTTAGTQAAVSAFAIAPLVAPNCFIAGLESTGALNPGTPGLENTTISAVEATDAWSRFDALAADYGFDNAALAASLLGLGVTGIAFLLVSLLSASFMYGSVASAYTLLLAGMMAPQYLLKGAFVLAALASIAAGAFWFGKTPR